LGAPSTDGERRRRLQPPCRRRRFFAQANGERDSMCAKRVCRLLFRIWSIRPAPWRPRNPRPRCALRTPPAPGRLRAAASERARPLQRRISRALSPLTLLTLRPPPANPPACSLSLATHAALFPPNSTPPMHLRRRACQLNNIKSHATRAVSVIASKVSNCSAWVCCCCCCDCPSGSCLQGRPIGHTEKSAVDIRAPPLLNAVKCSF